MCMQCLKRPEEGQIPETGVTDGSKPPCGCCKSNWGPIE